MRMTYLTLCLLAHSMICNGAWAGDKQGNGGGNEIIFASLSTQIQTWLNLYSADGTLAQKLQLNNSGISADQLVHAYSNAVSNTPDIKFIPASDLQSAAAQGDPGALLLSQNPSRICVNHSNPNYIRCNDDLFGKASGDTRYSINFHEFLGIAGIETNSADTISSYSQYPISKFLMQYVASEQEVKYALSGNKQDPLDYTCIVSLQKKYSNSPNSPFGPVIGSIIVEGPYHSAVGGYLGQLVSESATSDIILVGELQGVNVDPSGFRTQATAELKVIRRVNSDRSNFSDTQLGEIDLVGVGIQNQVIDSGNLQAVVSCNLTTSNSAN